MCENVPAENRLTCLLYTVFRTVDLLLMSDTCVHDFIFECCLWKCEYFSLCEMQNCTLLLEIWACKSGMGNFGPEESLLQSLTPALIKHT